MTRIHACLVSGACLLAGPALAGAQRADVRAIGPVRAGAQVAAGALATPVGFVGGGLVFRTIARRTSLAEDDISRVADVGAGVGITLSAAAGAALVGARGPGRGSFLAAAGGAALGTGASGLLVLLNRKTDEAQGRPCHVACILVTTAIATLPSIGATVAYDVSRRAR